jgi:hypothetical protein
MTRVNQFVPYSKSLEHDLAVIRHELGHALVSYYFGWQMGRVAFVRLPEGVLGGGARTKPRTEHTPEPEFKKVSVVRLLAGEIAARKFLELPLTHVCTQAEGVHELKTSFDVLRMFSNRNDDLSKALRLTAELHDTDFFRCFWGYYGQSVKIINEGWAGIEYASRKIEKHGFPKTENEELLIPALDII